MKISATAVNPWNPYNAWTELRADRAQLAADIAGKASPQVIAADKAGIAGSSRRLSVQAGRLDLNL
jgi:hypothetical protein